ncbi:Lysozyme RrrD [Dickeya dianthicola]|uniref:lysozyme n=1 Tax=Dickeya dianthicola TaxID=204039 RepID=UPI000CD3C0BE|nr:lysozyme [Dickeya dianthicola]AYC20054.1 Lysozyme RrrD [Dickeya dianthicola]MBI0437102.1 lysozyme [Dickeya dianthicola]MBI0448636.1 lysozyme [Dickeya dianthicola]MBI0452063.1 lysozyme [Dickeya dianthicola]MBI0456359.1 lysozyme [Dickeya dianthicola]
MSKIKNRLITAATGGAMAIAVALIQNFEGVRYTPYRDVVGVLTVCYGHTGPDIIPRKTYTEAECQALLRSDLQPVFSTIDQVVTVPMPDARRAALASFAYNVGTGALTRSTMLRKLNAGDTSEACEELLRWNKAGGREWKGLTNRREVERELCLAGK